MKKKFMQELPVNGFVQFFFLALFLVPAIFFLLTLQNTLKVINVENRRMSPANVWLMCIPFFNIVWQFIMVNRIAESLAAECAMSGMPHSEQKPTYNIGLAWNISNCLFFIPFLGALASLITWIIYWVKIAEYKKLVVLNKNNHLLDAEDNIFYGDKKF